MTRRRRRRSSQRGIAIVAVVTAVALCLVIVNEFGSRTTVDMMQSRNNLDQMRAHFLARSSLNLTDIIVRLQHQVDENAKGSGPMAQAFKGVQITDYADYLMAAFGGSAEQVEGAIGFGIQDTKGLGVDIGSFGVRITPVDGKVNINCGNANASFVQIVGKTMQSLVYPQAFDPVFEDPDAEGWRRDRNTQIAAILDYVDKNSFKVDVRTDGTIETTSAPEDYGYETLRDPYKPKNNSVDSIAELKLVRGVDDRFWTLFGNAFRVYGGCKVNLRAADDPKVIAAIIQLSAKDPKDPGLRPDVLWALANIVIQVRQMQGGMLDSATFKSIVEDPASFMAQFSGTNPSQPNAPPPPQLPPLPPGVKGITLDQQKLGSITEDTAIRTYQVEAWGEITREPFLPIRRTMRAVWDQLAAFPNSRNQLAKTGTWLYLREE